MAENIHNLTSAEIGVRRNKIVTHYAQIIVGGPIEKPCFSILYFDPTDCDYHVGFSSYKLEYVYRWRMEEFDIVDRLAVSGKEETKPMKCMKLVAYTPYVRGVTGADIKLTLKERIKLLFCEGVSVFLGDVFRHEITEE